MADSTEQSGQQQVKALFEAALDLAPGAREQFLQTQTDDAERLREVQELLHAHAHAGDFLATPLLLAAPSAKAAAGQRLGSYRLLREIGRGGMATVYLAERFDDEFQQQVAVKLLWPRADSAEVVRRFRQERQILAQLNHPNIARLLDGGTTEQGWPYLVMEYIEGLPLTKYCDAQRLSLAARLQLFQTVCAAVAYAHQNLVIHRDLKPNNILVTASSDGASGVPKLLDFGIAKVLTPETNSEASTRTGLQWLTPEYASPEQVREETITTASDVYSLGVLLYELLTGVRPHVLQDLPLHEIIRVLNEEDPLPPSRRVTPAHAANCNEASAEKLQRRLRGDLDNILLLALNQQAPARYQTVEQFSAELRRHLAGEPVLARQPTLVYRAGKFIRRHPTGVAVTLTLVLALLLTFASALHQTRQARAQAREQRRANYAAQLRQASAAWFDGDPRGYDEILQSAPVLPQPGEEDLRGLEWRYLWRLGHRERLSFEHTDGADLMPRDKGGYLYTWADNPLRFSLREARTGQPIAEQQLPGAQLLHSYFTAPDSITVLYQVDGHTLMTMDLLSGMRQPWFTDPSPVTCLATSDETGLLTGHADGQVKRWERQTGRLRETLLTAAGPLRALSQTRDYQWVITLTTDNVMQLWDVPRKRELLRLENVASVVARWSLKNWLVVEFRNNSLGVYDLRTARRLNTLDTSNNRVVFVSSQVQYPLAIGYQDNTVKFYELPTLRLLHNFVGHTGWVNSAMLSADGQRLLTASGDRTVKLWDVATKQALATLRGHHDDVTNAYWFDQDRQFASVSRDHVLKVWDVNEVLRPDVLTSHTGHVYSVAFAPDSRTLASASQDRTIKLWDVATGALLKTLASHTGQILCVNFSPDGQRLVSSGEGQAARVWEVATGKLLFELCCHQYQQHFAAFSPDGKLIATASDDSSVKLWDATNGCATRTLTVAADQTGHVQNIWSLAFAPDSRTLAVGTDKGELRLWDVASGRSIAAFHPHGDASIWSIAFTPDGQYFATASGDNTARLWSTATRQFVRTFKGHADGLFELAFSPDGQRLATASRDKTVRFWNVATGQELFSLKGHTEAVWSVAFAPDGNTLASGSWDGMVRLWRAASEPAGQAKFSSQDPAKK